MTPLERLQKKLADNEGNIRFFKSRITVMENANVTLREEIAKLEALPQKPKRQRKTLELPAMWAHGTMLVEQELFPRTYQGTDFGRDGQILIRNGTKLLFWTKGVMYWSGIGCQSYAQGDLHFVDTTKKKSGMSSTVEDIIPRDDLRCEGKLRKAIELYDAEIQEKMGIDFSFYTVYKPKTTMVIQEL